MCEFSIWLMLKQDLFYENLFYKINSRQRKASQAKNNNFKQNKKKTLVQFSKTQCQSFGKQTNKETNTGKFDKVHITLEIKNSKVKSQSK